MILGILGTICFIVGTNSPSILVNESMDSLALWSSVECFCMASAKEVVLVGVVEVGTFMAGAAYWTGRQCWKGRKGREKRAREEVRTKGVCTLLLN